MAKLGATMQSLCCFIILLMLLGEGVSASRQKLFTSIEQENKGIGNNKDAFVVLTKGPIPPPSGPGHRHNPEPPPSLIKGPTPPPSGPGHRHNPEPPPSLIKGPTPPPSGPGHRHDPQPPPTLGKPF
ncbi:hypothetical protein HN51_057459 [Arachis hypogaea]|nr:uncharacterized protein DS421_20g680270 [Arachis hypogaea]